MKYITFQDGNAVIFSDGITHSTMLSGRVPVGAGFCGIRIKEDEDGKKSLEVHATGWSESIGRGVSPHDGMILTKLLNKALLP